MATQPVIRCAHTRVCAPTELRPNPENPNRHPTKQLKMFAKVLQYTGWRYPVVVSNQSGRIVKGAGRHQAALMHGWPVPIDEQDYDDEAQEYADMVADNALPELAHMDKNALKALIANKVLPKKDLDVEVTGMMKSTIDKMFKSMEATDGAEFPITARLNEEYDYVVIFTENKTDHVYLHQLVGVRREKSYKNEHIGQGRVVSFARFMESLYANRDSLYGTRPDTDNAPNPE